MRAAILWSERARLDLIEIGDFIARDKPQAAERWVTPAISSISPCRAVTYPWNRLLPRNQYAGTAT